MNIKDAASCRYDLVSLGEVMLRLDPADGRISTTRNFQAWEGGGEYNVARGLRRCFGLRTAIVTALVDNPVGRLVEDLMLQGGCDLSWLRWVEDDGVGRRARNGLNFTERGFGVRAALGCSDRGHTAVSQMKPGDVDWLRLFALMSSEFAEIEGCPLVPGTFDVEAYRHAVDVLITAQEILVDNAGYPTQAIMANSHDYRPLGLGYANLGALLMAAGLPYDSDAGRDYAACVTAIMCGEAYLQSSRIAEQCDSLVPATEPTKKNLAEKNLGSNVMPGGACPGWYINREPFLDVIRMHRASVNGINKGNVPTPLFEASKQCWDEALQHGEKHGYRNSQVTVLAPTGTIGFMMDCDTTGIEPDLALIKYKKLVGGGMIKIVNNTVPTALFKLGYTHEQTDAIVSYVDATGTIEGAPHVKDDHLAVFDCSFKPAKGTRSIHYTGHLRMMAAAQPFISGAISKTVNLPENATIEDISDAYLQAWKLGLKAVAIYRDGCKKSQPLSAAGTKTASSEKSSAAAVLPLVEEEDLNAPPRAVRHKLQEERASITHKFKVGDHEGYITVGLYPNGKPGELFITMAKEGSTVSGLMDSFALAVSIALQHGVQLELFCDKFAHTRFEPSGWSGNPDIGYAKSIMDYIFRWLQLRFLTGQQQMLFENLRLKASPESRAVSPEESTPSTQESLAIRDSGGRAGSVHAADALSSIVDLGDAPTCSFCGSIMTRNGSCYRCMSCGSTSGCS